jgi:hypothetical protein
VTLSRDGNRCTAAEAQPDWCDRLIESTRAPTTCKQLRVVLQRQEQEKAEAGKRFKLQVGYGREEGRVGGMAGGAIWGEHGRAETCFGMRKVPLHDNTC